MHIQVNDRVVDWSDENKSRKTEPCKGCEVATKGHADLESTTRNFANLPYCMDCAMSIGFGGK